MVITYKKLTETPINMIDISFQIDVNANSSSNRTYFGNNNASNDPDYSQGKSYICNLTITFND